MSKVCSICNKGPSTGNNVSHSVRRTRRTFGKNLFTRKSNPFTGERGKTKLCAKCLKTSTKMAA